jgi:hypothetical protein
MPGRGNRVSMGVMLGIPQLGIQKVHFLPGHFMFPFLGMPMDFMQRNICLIGQESFP